MNKLSSGQVILMAATSGIAVANVYYSQPILQDIAQSYRMPVEKMGYISVLSQVGYGLGLFLLTPAGDMIERKRLILWLQGGLILALLITALSGNLLMLFAGSLLTGLFAVVAQVILPMAAAMVRENRGKVVGQVFTGILAGILLARVFSGFVAELFGWRYVYLISAAFVALSAALMKTGLPQIAPHFSGSYRSLISSTVLQWHRFPSLRRTAITGLLAFGTLSAFWVALTLHLSSQPFNYSASHMGLFGLLAAAGALAAPVFGKIADRGSAKRSLLVSTGLTLLSILLLLVFPVQIFAVFAAVILLDVGVQATQVTNIATIYALDATASSRINTVYMTSYFIGGAAGASLAIVAYQQYGWTGALLLMLTLSLSAIINVARQKSSDTSARPQINVGS